MIRYPHHPHAAERVTVARCLQHGGSRHFVIEQSDGTRALLPAWMTEPWAAELAIIERPRLPLEALHALRSTITSPTESQKNGVHEADCAWPDAIGVW